MPSNKPFDIVEPELELPDKSEEEVLAIEKDLRTGLKQGLLAAAPKEKPRREHRQWTLTANNWKPIHTQILIDIQRGLNNEEIGAKRDFCPDTIKRVRASKYFKQRLARASLKLEESVAKKMAERKTTDKVMSKLEQAATSAAGILAKAVRKPGSVTALQVKICQDILDRTGFKAKEKLEIESHERAYSQEEVESAKATLSELECAVTRLSIKGSKFILSKAVRNAPLGSATDEDPAGNIEAEVPASPVETPLDEVPPTDEGISCTSADRPETMPA